VKIIYLILIVLFFSCEKEGCKICKIKTFVPEKEVAITTEIVCYEIRDGYFISFDTLNREILRIVKCELKK